MRAPYKQDGTWVEPDTEWLEQQHLKFGKTIWQIARETGIHPLVMRDWVYVHGLRDAIQVSQDSDAPRKLGQGLSTRFVGVTEAWLRKRYIEQDQSCVDIARELGTSNRTVTMWLRRFNLPIRGWAEWNKHSGETRSGAGSPSWKGGTSAPYLRNTFLAHSDRKCAWCRTTENLQVHHIDHDKTNGNPVNLMVLCRNCNTFEGHLNSLVKAGRATWVLDEEKRTLTIQFVVAPVIRALEPGAEGHRGAR